MTALVGLCGTFSAGLFSWYVLHRHGGGLVLSVLFSMLVVWIYRRSRGGASGIGLPAARRRAKTAAPGWSGSLDASRERNVVMAALGCWPLVCS